MSFLEELEGQQATLKNADLLVRTFGPGKREVAPGHEIVEMGLVKLYRITGRTDYLQLAKFFIDARGKRAYDKTSKDEWKNGEYWQDDKPVTDQEEAEGHAVRAMYLYSGMTDVAALTGDKQYIAAVDRIWNNMVAKKFYVQGGIGAVPAVLTAFLLSFFPIAVNVATGLATVEPELEDVLRSLGATRIDIVLKVGLPRSLPYFFASLKIAITLAFVGAVIAETMASNEGIGTLIVQASSNLRIPLVFAALTVIAVMSIVMYAGFAIIERRTTGWATRSTDFGIGG